MRQGLCNDTVSVSLSVCPFLRRSQAAACGGFAAVGPAVGAQQQRRRSTALGSKCGQCHVYS